MNQDARLRDEINNPRSARRTLSDGARVLAALKLDGPLLVGIALIAVYSLVVQYSASGQDSGTILRTVERLGLGTAIMLALANCTPNFLRRLAPWLYGIGIVLLIIVDAIGYVGKGAQRWLDLGLFRFQPSEIMKLAVPMMCAWYLRERPLPPDGTSLVVLAAIVGVPAGLTVLQPDLGTGMLIAMGGVLVSTPVTATMATTVTTSPIRVRRSASPGAWPTRKNRLKAPSPASTATVPAATAKAIHSITRSLMGAST